MSSGIYRLSRLWGRRNQLGLDMGGNVARPDHPQSTKLGAVVWITGLDVASPQNRARGELGTISIW